MPEFQRIATGAIKWYWKETRGVAICGKQKGSVREETNAVSRTTVMSVQNQHQKTTPSSEPPTQRGRSAFEKKGFSEVGVHLGSPNRQPWKDFSKGIFALNYLVTVGILPNVSFVMGWGTTKLEAEKGWWQTCSGSCERCATDGLRIAGHGAAAIFIDFTEGPKNLGTNSTSAIHKSHAASGKYPRQ